MKSPYYIFILINKKIVNIGKKTNLTFTNLTILLLSCPTEGRKSFGNYFLNHCTKYQRVMQNIKLCMVL